MYPLPSPIKQGLLRFTSNFGLRDVLRPGPTAPGIDPAQKTIRVCPLVRIEMASRSRYVWRGHPAQKAQQALFADRAERVPVEVEDVDVAQLQTRLRRRQTKRSRDVGQRPPFSPRGHLHLSEEDRQVLRRRQIARLAAQGIERGASFLQRHRGNVDRIR